MDPNACLVSAREVALTIVNDDPDETEVGENVYAEHIRADELAQYVLALDEWLTKGGFLPESWTTPNGLQGAALMRLIEQRGNPQTVRKQAPDSWMLANYVVVTFPDGFECGIAPDGSVSS